MSWKGDLLKAGIGSNGQDISLFNSSVKTVIGKKNVNSITTAGDETYSASQILDGFIKRDPAGAARADTTDTAANIVSEIYDAKVGDSFLLYVRNDADAAETITVSGGTGVTIDGTATIDQNNTKIFLVRIDNIGSGTEAVTLYSIGTLTH